MRLLLLRLGRFLASAGDLVQAAALRGAGIVPVRKAPPNGWRSAPAAPQWNWRLPTAEEIDLARGECAAYQLPHVKICRGPGKGCTADQREQASCRDCYVVPWHDNRPSAEIRAAMERGDA